MGRRVEGSEKCSYGTEAVGLLCNPLRIWEKTLIGKIKVEMINQGKGLIEGSRPSLCWRKTLKLGKAVTLSLGKGREMTAFKQDTDVLAFLLGTALGHALDWLQRRVIVNLEPHVHLFLVLHPISSELSCFPQF